MSIFDDIRRDREAGTPGPWSRDGRLIYALISDGFKRGIERFRNAFSARVDHDPIGKNTDEADANARRIARVPDLERIALAAEELAAAASQLVEETIDYMKINDLGDPLEKRNIKMVCAALAKLREASK